MVDNQKQVRTPVRIKSHSDCGTFTPLQVAAIASPEGGQQYVRNIAQQYK